MAPMLEDEIMHDTEKMNSKVVGLARTGKQTYDFIEQLKRAKSTEAQAITEKNKPITEITFCLDNDDAGKHATEQLSDKYALKGYAVSKDIPLNKDFNDDLKAFRALEEKSIVQTTKPLRR